MISDDELREIFSLAWAAEWDRGLPEVLPDRSACERVARREVAEAAAKQATDNAAFVVEEAMSNAVAETPEWWALHDLAKTIRAASISTDKAGEGE